MRTGDETQVHIFSKVADSSLESSDFTIQIYVNYWKLYMPDVIITREFLISTDIIKLIERDIKIRY